MVPEYRICMYKLALFMSAVFWLSEPSFLQLGMKGPMAIFVLSVTSSASLQHRLSWCMKTLSNFHAMAAVAICSLFRLPERSAWSSFFLLAVREVKFFFVQVRRVPRVSAECKSE
jgi:hypothetical protein